MFNNMMRSTALLFALLLLSTVGGVFAAWNYAASPADPATAKLVSKFNFADIENANKSLASIFLDILNDAGDYESLTTAISKNYDGIRDWTASYIGNVPGASNDDITILSQMFGGDISLIIDSTEYDVTCIVKLENIDGDSGTGMSYSITKESATGGSSTTTYPGCEITLYLTTEKLIQNDEYATVYAMVFTKYSSNSEWVQIGESMYEGRAEIVGYVGGHSGGSFDTGTWTSSKEYHNLKSGSKISELIQQYIKSQTTQKN